MPITDIVTSTTGHLSREEFAIHSRVAKRIGITAGVLLLAGTGGIFWWNNRPSSPSFLAVDTLSKLLVGDSEAVSWRIPKEELSAYGIQRDASLKVLNDYISPRLRDLRRDGNIVLTENEATGSASAGQRLVSSSGDSLYISVSADLSPNGPNLTPFFSQALFTAVLAPHIKPGQARADRFITAVQAERSTLESYGIKGLQAGEIFKSWDELIEQWEMVKRRDARR